MKFSTSLVKFGSVGELALELKKALTAIAAGWNVEHNPDGTHKYPSGGGGLSSIAPTQLLGRGDTGTGPVEPITLSNSLIMTGTELSVRTGIFNYTYNSTLTDPPSAGQCRLDVAYPWTTVSKVWLRFISGDGQDLYWGIMIIPTGATMLLQDKDEHGRYLRMTTTGAPIDKGVYAEVPVTWVANGTAIITAQQVFVRIAGT